LSADHFLCLSVVFETLSAKLGLLLLEESSLEAVKIDHITAPIIINRRASIDNKKSLR